MSEIDSAMEDPDSRKARILIVDNDIHIVNMIAEIIKVHTTLIPITATSGKQGLELLDKNSIDVIILDLSMPRMDGLEFFQIIRNKSIYSPVIFLTGKGDEAIKNKAFELGAFDFLEKPAKAVDLFLLVDEAVKVMRQIRTIIAKKKPA